MKKNKCNGFLLAEAFIVSTFVLGVLIFMYIQTRNIINNYNKSFSYNTISDIYVTKEIDKYFKSKILVTRDDIDQLNSDGYLDITTYNDMMSSIIESAKIKKIIVSLSSMDWDTNILNVDTKFKDYISWVKKNNSDTNYDYIIITEFKDDTYASLKMGRYYEE